MSKPKVFISHSEADRDWARAFAQSLQAQGVRVWLDDMEIQLGQPVEKELERGLRGSDIIAFVLTSENLRSPNMLFELGAALGMRKPAVAIVPNDLEASQLPYPLRVRRFLRRQSPEETAKTFLAETAA